MKRVEIQRIARLPPEILTLEKEAVGEGFRFLTRLIAEWRSGANRFDAPGECLMAAYRDHRLIGIGGLSVDPYAQNDTARLRRLYVSASSRGLKVGQALVNALVEFASHRFRIVRLSTDTPEGDTFYRHCGFNRSDDDHATHTLFLGDA